MNADQRSVSAAFVVVLGILFIEHRWLQRFIAWLQGVPSTTAVASTTSGGSLLGGGPGTTGYGNAATSAGSTGAFTPITPGGQ